MPLSKNDEELDEDYEFCEDKSTGSNSNSSDDAAKKLSQLP